MKNKNRLFKRPSFLEGFNRAFDLYGLYSNYNPDNLSDEEIDYEAMKNDWEMVGYDLQTAMNQYDSETENSGQ